MPVDVLKLNYALKGYFGHFKYSRKGQNGNLSLRLMPTVENV